MLLSVCFVWTPVKGYSEILNLSVSQSSQFSSTIRDASKSASFTKDCWALPIWLNPKLCIVLAIKSI